MRAMKSIGKLCVMMAVGLSLTLAVSACGRKGPVEPPALTDAQ